MGLPVSVGHGRVVGRLVRGVFAGVSDGLPLPGATVTFTLNAKTVRGDTEIVVGDPVIARTDMDGYVLGPDGEQGVELLATDLPEPQGMVWRVRVTAPSITAVVWNIEVPAGRVVDLATAMHVPSDPSTEIPMWQRLRDEVLGYRDDSREAAEQAEAAAHQVKEGAVTATLGGVPGTLCLTFPALASGPFPHTVVIPIGA